MFRKLVFTLCLAAVPLSPAQAQMGMMDSMNEEGAVPFFSIPNHRQLIRDIVIELSDYAEERDPDFGVMVLRGEDLMRWATREFTLDELKRAEGVAQVGPSMQVGQIQRRYAFALDGQMLEGLVCGAAPMTDDQMDDFRDLGVLFQSVEHCASEQQALDALNALLERGIPAHADTDASGSLSVIPVRRPVGENPDNVTDLADVQNVVLLANTQPFPDKDSWLLTLQDTNYDLVIVDPFQRGDEVLSMAEVEALKYKRIGSKRLVFAYMDMGHAYDDRYYWDDEWAAGDPGWILQADLSNPGMYHIAFWHPRWKAIIGEYFKGLMDLGFDGVLLGGADAYEWFETRFPLE